jgi:hypothetical protein
MYFKCRVNDFHFLADSILPKSIALLFVKPHRLFPVLGNLDTKLMSSQLVPSVGLGNSSIPELESLGAPPSECWL